MSTVDELIAAAYLVGYLVPSLAVALRLAFRWSPDRLDRTLLILLLMLVQSVGVPLVLAMLGILDRTTLLAGHLVLAAAVLRFVPGGADGGERPRSHPSPGDLAAFGAVTAFVILGLFLALRGPSLDFDSRNYHLPHLAHWLQERSFWAFSFQLPGSWTSAHPGNGELLGLWLAVPSHGDELSLLAPTLFALLGIVAVAFLSRDLGGRAWAGALAGVAVFLTPLLFASQTRALTTDNAAAAGFAAATALVVRGIRNGERRWIAASGLALGLGLGSKYTALVPGAALVVACVVLLRRSRRWLWLLPGVLLFLGPWLIRNGLETGNPLWPQRVEIAGIELLKGADSPVTAFSTPFAEHLVRGHWSVVRRWGGHVVWWVGPVALLGAIGVAMGLRRRTAPAARALSFVALAGFLGYLVTPFTGGGPDGSIPWLLLNIRYALPAVLLGVALAGGLARRSGVVWLIAIALAYDAVRILQGTPAARTKDLTLSLRSTLAVLAVAGAAILLARTIGWRDVRRTSVLGIVAITTAGLAVLWGGTAVALHRANSRYRPTLLQALVDRARGEARIVEVVAVRDIRSVLGRRFDIHLLTPPIPAGMPQPSSEHLDAALRISRARALVVSTLPAYGVPTDYRPPSDWCLIGTSETESVYVRANPCPLPVAP